MLILCLSYATEADDDTVGEVWRLLRKTHPSLPSKGRVYKAEMGELMSDFFRRIQFEDSL